MHAFGNWTVNKAAGCVFDGEEQRSCSCGEKEYHIIKAKGHQYGKWETYSEATVFAAEVQNRICTVEGCNHTEIQKVGTPLKPTIKVNATKLPLKVKQSTKALKVTGLANGDSIVSWKSSNTKIVKVNQSGKITAQKKTGKAVITITLASGLQKKVTVTVQKGAVKTTKISGLKSKLTVQKGKKFTLKPVVSPITSLQKVIYSSSNKKVATVTSKGVITAKKAGTAKITVKSGSKKYVIKITVPKTKTTKIAVAKDTVTLKKGKTYTLKPVLTPKNSDEVITFKSSDKKIATVSSKGKVTAKKKGTAKITVKSGKKSITVKVTVR